MRAATMVATDGVGAERIEIVGERGLPMRQGFVLDWRLNRWLVGRGSARRLELSHSIHPRRYQARGGRSRARVAMVCLAAGGLRRRG